MEAFETLIDQFEIIHEDVFMRMFSRSLPGDVAVWFRGLETGSIGSWTELYHAFLKGWGENKSLDQYWSEFDVLRRGEDEALIFSTEDFVVPIVACLLRSDPQKPLLWCTISWLSIQI
jgi:hypothetical protein